jgi:peptidoglycan lytic transglycosylase
MMPQAPTLSADARHAAARRAAERRRRSVARRRVLLAVGAIGLVVLGVMLALPTVREAVNDLTLPLEDQNIIRQQAAEKRLDPALIAAVIYAETKFNSRTSSAGAQGLMQLMPETARFLAHRSGATTFSVSDLGTPAVNIAYGSYYLRYLLDRYGGSTMLALAAYNGGETNVDRWVAEAQAQGHTLTVDEIPFPETRAYVLRVLQAQQDYRRTYASQLGYT